MEAASDGHVVAAILGIAPLVGPLARVRAVRRDPPSRTRPDRPRRFVADDAQRPRRLRTSTRLCRQTSALRLYPEPSVAKPSSDHPPELGRELGAAAADLRHDARVAEVHRGCPAGARSEVFRFGPLGLVGDAIAVGAGVVVPCPGPLTGVERVLGGGLNALVEALAGHHDSRRELPHRAGHEPPAPPMSEHLVALADLLNRDEAAAGKDERSRDEAGGRGPEERGVRELLHRVRLLHVAEPELHVGVVLHVRPLSGLEVVRAEDQLRTGDALDAVAGASCSGEHLRDCDGVDALVPDQRAHDASDVDRSKAVAARVCATALASSPSAPVGICAGAGAGM